MGDTMDELMNAEFREAFDEFDKVFINILFLKLRTLCDHFICSQCELHTPKTPP